jgi:hypothetical protein
VGASIALRVRAACANRDLRGGRVDVMAEDEVTATCALVHHRDGFNETDTFAVTAPDRVGAFAWTVRFPAQDIDGAAYRESTLPVPVRVKPHRTSLAVWAVPSPVQIANRFAITVGAKSSGACTLSGAKVEIRDEAGARVDDGTLGDTPWPGTDGLYWAEIELTAPTRDGMFSWSAALAAAELKLPHLGSLAEFSFAAVKPPEHGVTVKVTENSLAAPVEEVQVALGPYRVATDRSGLAYIEVPAGTYDLAVWKSGFEAASKTVEIVTDLSVQFELTRLPEELTVWD